MTLKQAIKIVEQYQKWRRDPNVPPKYKMPHPMEVGKALDVLIIVAKRLSNNLQYGQSEN